MEESIFHRPEVVRELEKYVEVRLHTDVDEDWSRKLHELKKERLSGDETSPIYEVVDPTTGKSLAVFRGADPPRGARFRRFLAKNARRLK